MYHDREANEYSSLLTGLTGNRAGCYLSVRLSCSRKHRQRPRQFTIPAVEGIRVIVAPLVAAVPARHDVQQTTRRASAGVIIHTKQLIGAYR